MNARSRADEQTSHSYHDFSTNDSLPTKVYLNIMLMPKAQGYRYIIAARDDLSGAAEGRKLKKRQTARTVFLIHL